MTLPTDLSKNAKSPYAFKACEYIFYPKQKVQALFILFCPGLALFVLHRISFLLDIVPEPKFSLERQMGKDHLG